MVSHSSHNIDRSHSSHPLHVHHHELMIQSSQALETIMEGEGNKRHYVEFLAMRRQG